MGLFSVIEYFLSYLFNNIFGSTMLINLAVIFAILFMGVNFDLNKKTITIISIFLIPLLIQQAIVGQWAQLLFATALALVIVFALKKMFSGGGYGEQD